MKSSVGIVNRFLFCIGQDYVVTLDPISDLIALAYTEGGTDRLRDRVWALLVILLVIMTCLMMSASSDVRIFLTAIKRHAGPSAPA
jgi:hypothetical protein